jgi:hypothetical protein
MLMLGVCSIALVQFGFSLKDQLSGFQQSLAYKSKGVAVSHPGTGASLPLSNSQQGPAGGDSVGNPATLGTSLWTTPRETAQRIQVAGTNGTTREMLGSFEKWIQEMRDAGEIDDAQANKLQKMANDGHYLADAEKALEDAIAQGQKTFLFNGKTYTPFEMAEAIGLNPDSSVGAWDLDPAYAKSVISPLANSYQQASLDGTLSDPAVKQKVSELIIQIAAASDALSWNVDVALKGGSPVAISQFNQTTADYFQKNVKGAVVKFPKGASSASGLTDNNSGQICKIGSGKDNGQRCSN